MQIENSQVVITLKFWGKIYVIFTELCKIGDPFVCHKGK